MCSKCFRELDAKNKRVKDNHRSNTILPNKIESNHHQIEEGKAQIEALVNYYEEQKKIIIQKNKGKCFSCNSKIPITKQLINKCKCEYVFCDTHRYPDKHNCTFDHAKNDKDILAKNNPKLNEKKRGGNSFNRIDSL
ncbi:uncharacterized protein BX663DRAFT_432349 [Cokeromyces recurvatus]|uniref:uncharacterized protein n=1 Tax=Cokeromyces recurvatus TaxID=90255 RepID=UPI00221F080E|nr:uncharacterized protein BX663DRAFT_432349 [Cokeromyces recurvatus]KAI7903934.1 hypothetical protein BX663DRAFT_432349 [Cokeromyces recurvatus]